jgi:hypothetical protein
MNPANVIWIRLEKPTFDLIGVILSSFGITGICIGIAAVLGGCWGFVLIRRGRSRIPFEAETSLRLHPQAQAR